MRIALLLPSVLLCATSLSSQAPRFTVDDIVGMVLYWENLVGLSPDGRWATISASKVRDRFRAPVDYFRSYDPSYIPSWGKNEFQLIDTRTGAIVRPVDAQAEVLGTAWSPDGARLLMIIARKPG